MSVRDRFVTQMQTQFELLQNYIYFNIKSTKNNSSAGIKLKYGGQQLLI